MGTRKSGRTDSFDGWLSAILRAISWRSSSCLSCRMTASWISPARCVLKISARPALLAARTAEKWRDLTSSWQASDDALYFPLARLRRSTRATKTKAPLRPTCSKKPFMAAECSNPAGISQNRRARIVAIKVNIAKARAPSQRKRPERMRADMASSKIGTPTAKVAPEPARNGSSRRLPLEVENLRQRTLDVGGAEREQCQEFGDGSLAGEAAGFLSMYGRHRSILKTPVIGPTSKRSSGA